MFILLRSFKYISVYSIISIKNDTKFFIVAECLLKKKKKDLT